ncbi:hypothetical protein Hanom_Chr09g00774191 [Helianthus anomalus]
MINDEKRWDAGECYLDPQGNPVVDPKKVDFKAVIDFFPTCDTFYMRRSKEKDYETNLYKRLKEIEKLVEEVKKTAGEADENQQKDDEDQKLTTEESKLPYETEVKIQTESSESSNKHENVKQSVDKTEEHCRKCVETYKACTEKDENLKSRDIELTKIETVFKTKCKEMLKNEEF